MIPEHISDALNMLSDEIIEEACRVREKRRKSGRGIWKWTAAAACVCLVITGTVWHQFQSEETDNLPQISLSGYQSEGLGYESILCHDIGDMDNGNPWKETMELTTLPVYENNAHNYQGIPCGLDENDMLERLYDTARRLDMELSDIAYETYEDTIINITGTASSAQISVDADSTVTISFNGGLSLPEQYHFTYDDTTDAEADAVMNYFLKQYSGLLAFSQPRTVVSGNYGFDGSFHRSYAVYDSAGDEVDDMLNYTFRYVEFAPDDRGNLMLIRIYDGLACAEKTGDYPVISPKKALRLLLKGKYITSVPYEFPGSQYIGKAELVYRYSHTEKNFIPYYRFYVEMTEDLPKQSLENGLKQYGAYYVPAIEQKYISKDTIYTGTFN